MGVRRRPSMLIHAVLLILVGITLYPMSFMLVNAVKSGVQTAASPFTIPSHPLWQNFAQAFDATASAFWRSGVIVSVSVAAMLLLALMAAYAFAKLRFPGREPLFYVIFGLLLVPGFLVLIPLFLEIKDLHLLNSMWGLILPYIAGGQAFCIFILRTFIRSIPAELFEAAQIDGATDVPVFLRIVIPLSIPIVVTLALLNIVGLWGDYIFPSLVLGTSHETLAMAIANFQPPPFAPSINAFNLQLAAFTLASVPIAILFTFLMRYFVAGITNGSIKM